MANLLYFWQQDKDNLCITVERDGSYLPLACFSYMGDDDAPRAIELAENCIKQLINKDNL